MEIAGLGYKNPSTNLQKVSVAIPKDNFNQVLSKLVSTKQNDFKSNQTMSNSITEDNLFSILENSDDPMWNGESELLSQSEPGSNGDILQLISKTLGLDEKKWTAILAAASANSNSGVKSESLLDQIETMIAKLSDLKMNTDSSELNKDTLSLLKGAKQSNDTLAQSLMKLLETTSEKLQEVPENNNYVSKPEDLEAMDSKLAKQGDHSGETSNLKTNSRLSNWNNRNVLFHSKHDFSSNKLDIPAEGNSTALEKRSFLPATSGTELGYPPEINANSNLVQLLTNLINLNDPNMLEIAANPQSMQTERVSLENQLQMDEKENDVQPQNKGEDKLSPQGQDSLNIALLQAVQNNLSNEQHAHISESGSNSSMNEMLEMVNFSNAAKNSENIMASLMTGQTSGQQTDQTNQNTLPVTGVRLNDVQLPTESESKLLSQMPGNLNTNLLQAIKHILDASEQKMSVENAGTHLKTKMEPEKNMLSDEKNRDSILSMIASLIQGPNGNSSTQKNSTTSVSGINAAELKDLMSYLNSTEQPSQVNENLTPAALQAIVNILSSKGQETSESSAKKEGNFVQVTEGTLSDSQTQIQRENKQTSQIAGNLNITLLQTLRNILDESKQKISNQQSPKKII